MTTKNRSEYRAKYRQMNLEREKKYNREWNKKNAERHKIQNRTWYENKKKKYYRWDYDKIAGRTYAITLEDYNKLLFEQNYKCAICKMEAKENKKLCVDHCHKTGIIRGLLCSGCNTGIGLLKDNVESLQNAAQYLIKSREQIAPRKGLTTKQCQRKQK